MADILDLDVLQEDMAIDETPVEDDSMTVEKLKQRVTKRKGRGFDMELPRDANKDVYESIDFKGRIVDEVLDIAAQRSVEGWILVATGVHEEAHEDDVQTRFAEYGDIKNLHLNLDRRTGFLKGYALIEYEHFKEASAAKNALDGTELLGNKIKVEFAFMKKPTAAARSRRRRN